MNTGTEPAHRTLELLITKTIISGKPSSSRILIDQEDLQSQKLKLKSNLKLKVEIKCTWELDKKSQEDT